MATSTLARIAFIGNYLPRQCGIATFTTDLCEAVAAEYADTACIALPVNDVEAGYDYPPRVRFELAEKDIDSYRRAADFLNINNVDLVCLQHEYGIFGGRAGSHILALLRELRMPVVTTLHTILRDPDPDQRRVLEEVAALSDRVVVMSERGAEFLQEVYGVAPEKIDLHPARHPRRAVRRSQLPQGPVRRRGQGRPAQLRPAVAEQGDRERDRGAARDRGPSPERGLHDPRRDPPARAAERGRDLPAVPGVAGAGQGRRRPRHLLQPLRQRSRSSSSSSAPPTSTSRRTCNAAQITSGTLAYTLGAGKAVISTPYWYAEELLADERGVARAVPGAGGAGRGR